MYRSEISAADFVAQIKAELDIVPAVPDHLFVRWLNALEQLLYTELVKAERWATVTVAGGQVDLSAIEPGEHEAPPAAWDVAALYADGLEIPQAGLAVFHTLADSLYAVLSEKALAVKPYPDGQEIGVLYYARPALKQVTEGVISDEPVALPEAFLDLAAARLLGEAFRLAEDDAQAARWLADYNTRLEHFSQWVKNRGGVG